MHAKRINTACENEKTEHEGQREARRQSEKMREETE